MKKIKKILLLIIITALVILIVIYSRNIENNTNIKANITETNEENNIKNVITDINQNETVEPLKTIEKNNFVSYNGNLKVNGTYITNEKGEKIQLKGISSHGIQWYSNFANESSLRYLKESFGANVFRIAMYTEENGYIANNELKNKVKEIVQYACNLDMYVIIDWHILNDNNPNIHINEAKNFFDEMSREYANVPNVIYEICNEPNGNISWNNDIKPYAESIIATIRNNSKNSLIIVGTGMWCQNLEEPANNPINNYDNIIYACHFYAGTHKEDLRNSVIVARMKGIPIIVSECGVSAADGNGGIYKDEADKWFDFLNQNNISWIVWSFCDKGESSALLKNGTDPYNIKDENLSEAGIYIKSRMK